MEPWQQRVVEEREALSVKTSALQIWLNSQTAPDQLMLAQLQVMQHYLEILDKRIAGFTPAHPSV